MCGIIAYLGTCSAIEYILAGLALLQNRGYDSAGVCTITEALQLLIHKFASRRDVSGIQLLEEIRKEHTKHTIGIGHTRWATHGAKTDSNAHPHLDNKQQFAVVHNGIIENYLDIKRKLEAAGFTFESQTDTEVIPKLLEYNLQKEQGRCTATSETLDFAKNVLKKTIDELEGTWALCILFQQTPDTLYLCKNGSPLVIGHNDNFLLVASEQLPLSMYFNNYITLNDGDIVTVSKNVKGTIDFLTKSNYTEHTIQNKIVETSCYPFPHWTIKEIYEQPMSIMRSLNMGGRLFGDHQVKLGGLDSKREYLLPIEHLIVLGCGTSLNAGHIGTKMIQSLKCFTSVTCIDASEFSELDIPLHGKVGFVLISQSGETKDVHRCIDTIRKLDCPILSIVNVVGSLISRESDCGIYLNAGREVGVASTKSFTSQLVALTLLGIWFSQQKATHLHLRSQYIKNLKSLSTDVERLLSMISEPIKKIAERFHETRHMFLLGRGIMKHIADEGALKIKEIGYIHAEGYAGGALKHGPFALINRETVVIIFAPRNDDFGKMINAATEVHSRSARILLITNPTETYDFNTSMFEDIIPIVANTHFQSVLSIVVIQLLAYEIAKRKGHNPDFPRNLAKVVTVDG
jgi:glucosamine--fructose-6-phosphate aminotransferase (isomerizing)